MATVKKIKNLANCKPSEFLAQTNKIRKSVYKWLTLTDISNIRKRLPEITEDMSEEDVKAARTKQVKDNFNAILSAILEEHPQETLELLALTSFVDPKDVDNYTVDEYLQSFTDLINDKTVINFFTSLMSLGHLFG